MCSSLREYQDGGKDAWFWEVEIKIGAKCFKIKFGFWECRKLEQSYGECYKSQHEVHFFYLSD